MFGEDFVQSDDFNFKFKKCCEVRLKYKNELECLNEIIFSLTVTCINPELNGTKQAWSKVH